MGIKIQVINQSNNPLPVYKTEGAAAMDLSAYLVDNKPLVLLPFKRVLVETGLRLAIPFGLQGEIRTRSGLAIKHGIVVLNSPGTIDSDYRGEIKISLINFSSEPFYIQNGDRIAQLVISHAIKCTWEQVACLSATERGTGGFGSTGLGV